MQKLFGSFSWLTGEVLDKAQADDVSKPEALDMCFLGGLFGTGSKTRCKPKRSAVEQARVKFEPATRFFPNDNFEWTEAAYDLWFRDYWLGVLTNDMVGMLDMGVSAGHIRPLAKMERCWAMLDYIPHGYATRDKVIVSDIYQAGARFAGMGYEQKKDKIPARKELVYDIKGLTESLRVRQGFAFEDIANKFCGSVNCDRSAIASRALLAGNFLKFEKGAILRWLGPNVREAVEAGSQASPLDLLLDGHEECMTLASSASTLAWKMLLISTESDGGTTLVTDMAKWGERHNHSHWQSIIKRGAHVLEDKARKVQDNRPPDMSVDAAMERIAEHGNNSYSVKNALQDAAKACELYAERLNFVAQAYSLSDEDFRLMVEAGVEGAIEVLGTNGKLNVVGVRHKAGVNDGDFFTLTENSTFMRVVLDAAVSVMGKYSANVEVWHILKRYVGDDAAAASRSFVLLYALQGVLVKLGCKATAEKIRICMSEHRKQVATANGFRGSTVRLTWGSRRRNQPAPDHRRRHCEVCGPSCRTCISVWAASDPCSWRGRGGRW